MQLPCVDLGAVPVGGLVLYPFGGIVAIGIGVGWWMMSKRAKLLGFDEHEFVALRLWALGLGFFFAHALDEVFYHPDMLAARPDLAEMLITQRFPLDDAPRAYEKARDRSSGVFRVVVEP